MRIKNLVVNIVLVSFFIFCGCPLFKGEDDDGFGNITDILIPEEALPVLTGRYFKARVKSEKTGNLDDSLHVIYPKEFLVNLPVYLTEEHQDELLLFRITDVDTFFDEDWQIIRKIIATHCDNESGDRFTGIDEHFPFEGARQVRVALCMGSLLSTIVQSPIGTVIDTPSYSPFTERARIREIPSGTAIVIRQTSLDDYVNETGTDPSVYIPHQDASGRATLALASVVFYRAALLIGSAMIRRCDYPTPEHPCPFDDSVASGRHDGEEGVSDEEDDIISYASVLVMQLLESNSGMRDALEITRRNILAASALITSPATLHHRSSIRVSFFTA